MLEAEAGVRRDIEVLVARMVACVVALTSNDVCDLDYNKLVALRTQLLRVCIVLSNTAPGGVHSHRPPQEDV